ncbi:hypothetical protein C0J52_06289 [Blattella germanica]|nr:hypothetical protein C0J52_06289 [Blattella germanica]
MHVFCCRAIPTEPAEWRNCRPRNLASPRYQDCHEKCPKSKNNMNYTLSLAIILIWRQSFKPPIVIRCDSGDWLD